MKKTSIYLTLFFLITFVFASCSQDSALSDSSTPSIVATDSHSSSTSVNGSAEQISSEESASSPPIPPSSVEESVSGWANSDAEYSLVVPEYLEMDLGESYSIEATSTGFSQPVYTYVGQIPSVARVDFEGTIFALSESITTVYVSVDEGDSSKPKYGITKEIRVVIGDVKGHADSSKLE